MCVLAVNFSYMQWLTQEMLWSGSWKICKKISKKIAKSHYLSIFFKIMRYFFARSDKNTISWEMLRYFRKLSKDFFRKFQKSVILAYFSKNLTSLSLFLRAFGRKTQFLGKFWEIFENIQNICLENFEKKNYFCILFEKFGKAWFISSRVWTKTTSFGSPAVRDVKC